MDHDAAQRHCHLYFQFVSGSVSNANRGHFGERLYRHRTAAGPPAGAPSISQRLRPVRAAIARSASFRHNTPSVRPSMTDIPASTNGGGHDPVHWQRAKTAVGTLSEDVRPFAVVQRASASIPPPSAVVEGAAAADAVPFDIVSPPPRSSAAPSIAAVAAAAAVLFAVNIAPSCYSKRKCGSDWPLSLDWKLAPWSLAASTSAAVSAFRAASSPIVWTVFQRF